MTVRPKVCLVGTLLFLGCGEDTPRCRAGAIVLRSSVASVEICPDPYSLQLVGTKGELVAAEKAGAGAFYERGDARHRLLRVASQRALEPGLELVVETTEGAPALATIRFATERAIEVVVVPPAPETVTALGEAWESPPDELIYGLTERLRDSPPIAPGIEAPVDELAPPEAGTLNRRGEAIEMYVRPTRSLYAPFYQSSRGYGLLVAGTAVGAFDVAKRDPGTLRFRFETGASPDSRRLRFHLFYGPEHGTILDEYTALTGRPFVPPDWAFLHWRYRDELTLGSVGMLDGTEVHGEVAEDVTKYAELGIPAGVYLIDRPWAPGEFGFARFAWDQARLPHAQAMLASLRRRGYRIAVWSSTWACGSDPQDNGTEAMLLGYLAPGSQGAPHCANEGGRNQILDVTNPALRAWWQGKLHDFLVANDISAIKLDRGEEFIPSAPTDIWSDGRSGREVHNDYPNLQAAIHHDALFAARPGDFALLSRPGYAGTSRYAIFWSGDVVGTELGLREVILGQQRAAFMGFPIWASEAGGYYEFGDREVFARWLEFAAFSGIMLIGGTGNHAPWNMPSSPAYDPEMIDIYRRYTALRVTLQSYLVAAAQQAGATGMPMVRPLVFLDREDPALRDRWDQYLLGPDLMVAPVWKSGQRAREVYFPRGRWRSYWDRSQVLQGPSARMMDVPLSAILVFVRGDADVPGP